MNRKKLSLAGMLISFVGVILSLLLAVEYFGLGSENIANAACSALGGADSCVKVAQSAYSAIPNVPLLGNVPIALFGFGYYGLTLFLFFRYSKAESDEDLQSFFSILLLLVILAEIVDIILLIISLVVIGTLCILCFLTYTVTAALLAIGLLAWLYEKRPKINVFHAVKNSFSILTIVFFFAFSVGFAMSRYFTNSQSSASLISSKGMDVTSQKQKLDAYFASPTLGIQSEGFANLGKKDAPITIVKYADYNCGHCMHTSHILHTVLSEYDGMVKVVFKNFPLDGSCNRLIQQPRPGASSCVAAMASICADKQGKFEPMYRGLYDNLEKGVAHTTSSVLNLGNVIGLNMNQLKQCMSSKEAQTQLNAEIEEAAKLQIQATPSLFINDRRIDSGTPNEAFLKALLETLIQKL